jgi:hypothetical protein
MPPKPTSRELAHRIIDELRSAPAGKSLKISVEEGSGVTIDSLAAALSILAREQDLKIAIVCGKSWLHVGEILVSLDFDEPKGRMEE